MVKKSTTDKTSTKTSRFHPPVVVVLGHVDHGKTTLLDAIRKTNIADRESGGITQKIGASTIDFLSDGKQKRITFIDTPGHEAFIKMRSRGAQAGDLALLVVSSVDGVMPQTKESIELLKTAQTPFICVLTKSDLPDKNPKRVKQQLVKEGVMLEEFAGDVPVIEVSAKTNTNIKELLDLILLVFELKADELNVSEEGEFKAIVIESRLDPKAGPKATIVVKNGSVSQGEEIIADGEKAKIRSMVNDRNERCNKATIGDAVEILGFEKVPQVGSVVKKKTLKDFFLQPQPKGNLNPKTLNDMLSDQGDKKSMLSLVLCADALGSLEAIINSLPQDVNIVLQKTGEITPSDILFAKSVGAIAIGYNIKVRDEISRLAATEKVLFKNYNLIYELLDEIKNVIKGKKLKVEEEIFGKAQVLASFPFEKTKVLGIRVLEGRVAKGDRVRLLRGDVVLGESTISSLRSGKEVVSKIEKGKEAGIILAPFLDFAIGDVLIFMPQVSP